MPVQSLGFSAFDLMSGRFVSGTLSLIKQFWLAETVDEKTNMIDFVLDLSEKSRVRLKQKMKIIL